ncbi:MAG: calcium-binding protein [Cyanobacteria bacterium]|nr:calcium-binding protein [Cyanobacteriota bacterium]
MASVVLPPVIEPLNALAVAPAIAGRKLPVPINLIGTEADDVLYGNKGNNAYLAGAGADLINGSSGNDSMSGGSGIDTLDYSGLNADITFSRGGVITKSGGNGVDTIAAFDIEVIKGNAKRINTIDGSSGTTAAINVDLSSNSLEITGLPGIGSAKLTVINFSNVNGSENNDVILGDDKANTLNGGGGNDTISGGGGDDLLLGSTGSDLYRGGAGADTLSYEAFAGGVTLVRGGTIIKADGSVDTIADFAVETIVGTKGAVNTIDGSTGVTAALNVNLSKQNLTITGLPFVGTAALTVKNFTDVKGSENADVITGDKGANRLSGNGGNDVLTGLGGKDLLTGGSGADTFVFGYGDSLLSGFDLITDLEIGVDAIDGWAATAVTTIGRASSLNAGDLGRLFGNNFLANGAAAFVVGSTGGDRTFLALNDSQLGFQAGKDLIIEITGYTGSLSNLAIV